MAVVGAATNVMITLSCEAVHGALAIVQRNVYAPATVTVTFVVARLAFTNVDVPGPAICVQVPVPVVGTLPANVAVNQQTVASGPAFEAVGGAFTITEI